MNLLLAIFLFAIWSSSFAISKGMLEFAPPFITTGLRMTLAGAILLGYFFMGKRGAFTLSKRGWLSIGLLGVVSVFGSNVLELWGMESVASTKACFIYSLSPFMAALLSYLHFREKVSPLKWAGMIIGCGSTIIPLWLANGFSFSFSLGELALILAAFSGVWGWVLLRACVKDESLPPKLVNGLSMAIGGFLALLFAPAVESFSLDGLTAAPFLYGLITLLVLSNLFCYNLYGYLLSRQSATLLSLIGLTSPFFASLHGWWILGERPPLDLLMWAPGIFIGLLLFYIDEKRLTPKVA